MAGVDGVIGNRALLQSIADQLGIEGVRRFPKELNTADVKVVLDLAQFLRVQPPAAPASGLGEVDFRSNPNISIASASGFRTDIVGDYLSSGIGLSAGTPANPFTYQFDLLNVAIRFDSAGATLRAGQVLRLKVILQELGGDPGFRMPIVDLDPWCVVASNKFEYHWSLSGWADAAGAAMGMGWRGGHRTAPVPGGSTTNLGITLDVSMGYSGLAFPANTTADLYSFARRSTNKTVPDIIY